MAGKSPSPKRGAAKVAATKAPATNRTAQAPAAKKPKAALAAKKGPIALRKPAVKKPAASESGTYYVVIEHADVRIASEKPKSTGRVETAATFSEAKEMAVDHLIDLIDRFERRLWEVKQSQDQRPPAAQD